MSFLKRILRLFRYILQLLDSLVTDITAALALIIKQPFYDLAAARRQKKKLNLKSVLLLPFRLVLSVVSILGRTLLSPAEFVVGIFRKKPKELLWTLPWLVGFFAIGGVVYAGVFNTEARLNALRKQANEAFENEKYLEASRHFARLIRDSPVASQEDLFRYQFVLANCGKTKESIEILRQLAPNSGSPGYGPAHEFVAIGIVREMKRPPNALTLKNLKWHLDNAPESKTPEINRCWAEYYLFVRDPENALVHMKAAAELKPEYLVMVADIYRDLGNRTLQMESLSKAAEKYKSLVQEKPLLHKNRIMYARILKDLGKVDSAERTLLAGVDLKNNQEIRSACCGFYLVLFNEEENTALARKLQLLSKSLEYDQNHVPAYEALIRFYRTMESDAPEKKRTISVLRSWVESSAGNALAHFALGNILWTEQKFQESQDLLEKAFELDPRFALIANNLAWLLAHGDEPDLDRAADLAERATAAKPQDGRIRDTFATILLKQEKFDESLAEFQIALQQRLPQNSTKREIHRKMATAYKKLGKKDLAKQHERQAAQFQ